MVERQFTIQWFGFTLFSLFLLLNARNTSKIETPIPRQQEVTGGQLILRYFQPNHPHLISYHTLAKAAKEREDDRLKLIPNLRSQTFLIASYVLGKIRHDRRLDEGDHILGRIGIFYDYLWLRQPDRTNEEEELFCNMLKKL